LRATHGVPILKCATLNTNKKSPQVINGRIKADCPRRARKNETK